MTVDIGEWLRLRTLLREAAEAADTAEVIAEARALSPASFGDEPVAPAPSFDPAERERVIELGVTGLIVRFSDNNPVLLGAISRIQGWRPNPSGSHHIPCTIPAIAGLLAFAEMYDFELTDGADSMVRQLIRDSYRTREWQRQSEARAAKTAPATPAPRPVARRRESVLRWLAARRRWLTVAAVVLYLSGPRIDLAREPERAYLDHAQLGADASVARVLNALSSCDNALVMPGAQLPEGCDAVVATRAGLTQLSLGFENPRVRIFSLRNDRTPRGFAICDQSQPLEVCWER